MDKTLIQRMVTSLGYYKINWSKARPGQVVYRQGIREGHKWAYGPYTVKNSDKRILVDQDGEPYKDRHHVLLIQT